MSGLTTKADNLLLQQLDALGSSDEPLQAWFHLKDDSAQSSSEGTTSLAKSVVERVKKHVGGGTESLKVLPNLNSFMISARPDFVRELMDQPEIESARSTNVPGFGLVKPVQSKPARILSGRRFSSRQKRAR